MTHHVVTCVLLGMLVQVLVRLVGAWSASWRPLFVLPGAMLLLCVAATHVVVRGRSPAAGQLEYSQPAKDHGRAQSEFALSTLRRDASRLLCSEHLLWLCLSYAPLVPLGEFTRFLPLMLTSTCAFSVSEAALATSAFPVGVLPPFLEYMHSVWA